MIGWRKIIALVFSISVLMVGALYMVTDIYSSFVWGVVCLGGAYIAGNAGVSIFESIKNKQVLPGVQTSHEETTTIKKSASTEAQTKEQTGGIV